MAQAAMRQSTDERHALLARSPKKLDRFVEEFARQRILDRSKVVQDIARVLEGIVVIEPLQNFLNDRQASDDLCHIDQILDAERRPQAQSRDPYARIDQNHGSLASTPLK
jgi:hypothetical protein